MLNSIEVARKPLRPFASARLRVTALGSMTPRVRHPGWLLVVLAFVTFAKPAFASAPAAPGEPRVSYELDVRLLETTHERYVIEGRETITLHNNSIRALDELALHLYMNAFAEGSLARTLPFLDSRAALHLAVGEEGSIDIHTFRDQRDGALLEPRFATPEADRTSLQVALSTPVQPGARASFELHFTTQLPALTQRTGSAGSFVFAGQWFPKLAKLEPDGTWTQFVFHPQAEFYANFGSYDVTLDTPREYVVGATGVLNSEQLSDHRRVSRYLADGVHDFAWTAWPEFESHDFLVGDTQVRALFPPHNERNRDVTVQAVHKALPWLQAWLGPYALPTLTIVHPPDFASAASGMEYPGLITTGGARLMSLVSHAIERVVIHELSHQWFYGSVASNEHAWPFMDEGVTMYVENRALRELYSGSYAEVLRYVTTFQQYSRAYAARHDANITSNAAAFTSFGQLAALAYDRAALVFETFARVYGPTVDRAFGDYARAYAGHHPTPDDLLRVFERHLDKPAADTLRTALANRGWVNYRVRRLDHVNAPDDPERILNRVLLSHQGTLSFPVDVALTESNGQVHTHQLRPETWSAQSTEHELTLVTATPLVLACVDPERRVMLDDEPADNCRSLTEPSPPAHWTELLLSLQALALAVSW